MPSCNATTVVNALQRSIRVRYVLPNVALRLRVSSKRAHGRRGATASMEIHQVTKLLNANRLWDMGFRGVHFDTLSH